MKTEVIEILERLRAGVQMMREEGEGDLRSVLYRIDDAISDVMDIEDSE